MAYSVDQALRSLNTSSLETHSMSDLCRLLSSFYRQIASALNSLHMDCSRKPAIHLFYFLNLPSSFGLLRSWTFCRSQP